MCILDERVLIVDDEKSIVDVLSYALTKEGFIVEKAYDGQEALEKFNYCKPQIIILDLMLPKINGYDLCKKLNDKDIGIIMLTAKNDIVDKILGLELGADDYITKPFDIRELIARVKSLARRFKKASAEQNGPEQIKIDGFVLNSKEHTVIVEGTQIEFTAKEFELLYLLLSNPNIAYSRDKLLDLVWDTEYFGGTRTVDTHIQRIRKKLGNKYQNIIVTLHGVGYKGVTKLDEDGD